LSALKTYCMFKFVVCYQFVRAQTEQGGKSDRSKQLS
jgi:hypothetical protein